MMWETGVRNVGFSLAAGAARALQSTATYLAILVLSAVGFAGQASAQAGGVVCVYDNPDFGGRVLCTPGEDRIESLGPFLDDRISSFRVSPGWRLTACRDANYGGWCRQFDGSQNSLRASNDKISSFTVSRVPPEPPPAATGVVCLYADSDFGGASQCVGGEATVSFLGPALNDRVSSFSVQPGWQLTVCRDYNFGGWCRDFTEDQLSLRASNDKISSFRVARMAAPPPPPATGVVCLFADPDFGGAARCVDGEAAVNRLGFALNDRVSSFRVAAGWQLTVCRDVNYGGWCRSFTDDERNLRASNDRISSFRVTRVAPPEPPAPSGVVCLYADPGFRGAARCVDDEARVARLGFRLNDRVSSFRVAPGWRLTACRDFDFGGWCREFDSDQGSLRASNDKISSFVVTRVPAPQPNVACLYRNANFGGASTCSTTAERVDALPPGMQNRVSSIRLADGWSLIACNQPGLAGFCRQVVADEASLGPALNDRLASYQVFPAGSPPGGGSGSGGGGIFTPGPGGGIDLGGIIGAIAGEACLHEHINFGGAKFCGGAGTEQPSLAPSQNDVASSVTVPNGLALVACEHFNYGGQCRRYESDVRFLGPGFNDRISSYRIVPNF